MTPEEAVAVACERCVTAASMLAASRLSVDADDRTVGRVLADGVVCGWADHTSVGSADAKGITVRQRGELAGIPVRWTQVAAALRPGLREPGVAARLDEVYERYVAAATDTSVAGRLAARVASTELAQLRRRVLDGCRAGAPVQQSLFPTPPSRGRSLA
jgi:hypothetical protein